MGYIKLLINKPKLFLGLISLILIDSLCIVITPLLWSKAISNLLNKETNLFLIILSLYSGTIIIKELNSLIMLRLERSYYTEISRVLRGYIYESIFKMNPRDLFLENQSHLSLFINDASLIRDGIESLNSLIHTVFVVIATVVIMLLLAPLPSLIVIFISLLFLLPPILLRNRARRLNNSWVSSIGRNLGLIKNLLDGYQVYRLNRGDGYSLTYSKIIKGSALDVIKRLLRLVRLNLFSSFFAYLPSVIAFLITGVFVYYGYLGISPFLAIGIYIADLNSKIFLATHHINRVINGASIIKRIASLRVSYPNKTNLNSFISLDLKDISISFEDKEIISNLSLSLKAGRKYLLVGRSGSGKSSLAQVILGILKPNSGGVFWNGKDLSGIDPRLLLKYVYMISASDKILEASLRENITMFDDNLTGISIEEAIDILSLSHLKEAEKLNSDSVSAGEEQRILLARFLVMPRDVLILDEALVNLDRVNRERIENYLLSLPGLTLIHITHQVLNQDLYDEVIDLNILREVSDV